MGNFQLFQDLFFIPVRALESVDNPDELAPGEAGFHFPSKSWVLRDPDTGEFVRPNRFDGALSNIFDRVDTLNRYFANGVGRILFYDNLQGVHSSLNERTVTWSDLYQRMENISVLLVELDNNKFENIKPSTAGSQGYLKLFKIDSAIFAECVTLGAKFKKIYTETIDGEWAEDGSTTSISRMERKLSPESKFPKSLFKYGLTDTSELFENSTDINTHGSISAKFVGLTLGRNLLKGRDFVAGNYQGVNWDNDCTIGEEISIGSDKFRKISATSGKSIILMKCTKMLYASLNTPIMYDLRLWAKPESIEYIRMKMRDGAYVEIPLPIIDVKNIRGDLYNLFILKGESKAAVASNSFVEISVKFKDSINQDDRYFYVDENRFSVVGLNGQSFDSATTDISYASTISQDFSNFSDSLKSTKLDIYTIGKLLFKEDETEFTVKGVGLKNQNLNDRYIGAIPDTSYDMVTVNSSTGITVIGETRSVVVLYPSKTGRFESAHKGNSIKSIDIDNNFDCTYYVFIRRKSDLIIDKRKVEIFRKGTSGNEKDFVINGRLRYDEELRGFNDQVADTLEFFHDRPAKLTKNISNFRSINTSTLNLIKGNNVQYVTINLSQFDDLFPQESGVINNSFMIPGIDKEVASNIDSGGNEFTFMTTTDKLMIAFPSNTFDTPEIAKERFKDIKILYRLAVPKITTLPLMNNLIPSAVSFKRNGFNPLIHELSFPSSIGASQADRFKKILEMSIAMNNIEELASGGGGGATSTSSHVRLGSPLDRVILPGLDHHIGKDVLLVYVNGVQILEGLDFSASKLESGDIEILKLVPGGSRWEAGTEFKAISIRTVSANITYVVPKMVTERYEITAGKRVTIPIEIPAYDPGYIGEILLVFENNYLILKDVNYEVKTGRIYKEDGSIFQGAYIELKDYQADIGYSYEFILIKGVLDSEVGRIGKGSDSGEYGRQLEELNIRLGQMQTSIEDANRKAEQNGTNLSEIRDKATRAYEGVESLRGQVDEAILKNGSRVAMMLSVGGSVNLTGSGTDTPSILSVGENNRVSRESKDTIIAGKNISGKFGYSLVSGNDVGSERVNNEPIITAGENIEIKDPDTRLIVGKYNDKNTTNTVEVIAWGISSSDKRNIRTLDINGNEELRGALKVKGEITDPKHVVTKEYLEANTFNKSNYGNLIRINGPLTLDITHINSVIISGVSAIITIPTDTALNCPLGSSIVFIVDATADVTMSPSQGVTLYSKENKRTVDGIHSSATLIKTGENKWHFIGAIK